MQITAPSDSSDGQPSVFERAGGGDGTGRVRKRANGEGERHIKKEERGKEQ